MSQKLKQEQKIRVPEEEYVVSRRNDKDSFSEFYYRFYLNLRAFYEKGHPLYIQIATEEDIKAYLGNHKCGDYY